MLDFAACVAAREALPSTRNFGAPVQQVDVACHEDKLSSPEVHSSSSGTARKVALKRQRDRSLPSQSKRGMRQEQQTCTFMGPRDVHKLHGNWVHTSIITGVLTVRGKTVTPSVGPPLNFRVKDGIVHYLGFRAIRERSTAQLITWVKGSGEYERTWLWHRQGASYSTPGQPETARSDWTEVPRQEIEWNLVSSDTNSKFARAARSGGSKKLPITARSALNTKGGVKRATARIHSDVRPDVVTSDEKDAKQNMMDQEFMQVIPPQKKARTKKDLSAERMRSKEDQNASQEKNSLSLEALPDVVQKQALPDVAHKQQKVDDDLLSSCNSAPISSPMQPAPGEGERVSDNSKKGILTLEEKITLQDKMDSLSDEQTDLLQDFLEECSGGALNDQTDEVEFDLDILPADKVQAYVKLVDKMLEESEAAKMTPTDCCSTTCPTDSIPDDDIHVNESTSDCGINLCPDDGTLKNDSHEVESAGECSLIACPAGSITCNESRMVENLSDCSLNTCSNQIIPDIDSHDVESAGGDAASLGHTRTPSSDEGSPQKKETKSASSRQAKKKACDKICLLGEEWYGKSRKATAKDCKNDPDSASSAKLREKNARALAKLKRISEQVGEQLAVCTVKQLNDTSVSLSIAITSAKESGAPASDLQEFKETEENLQCQLAMRIQALTRLTEVENNIQDLLSTQSEGVSSESTLRKAKAFFEDASKIALESGASVLDIQEYKARHHKHLQEFRNRRDGHLVWQQTFASQAAKDRAREEARKRLRT